MIRQNVVAFVADDFNLVHGLPDNARLGISRGKLTLKGNDVRKVFEPVVHEVLKLVMDQIRNAKHAVRTPRAVVMVGGFGQNAYLRNCIREVVSSSNVEVLQSPNGYSFILLSGAVPMLTTSAGQLWFEGLS